MPTTTQHNPTHHTDSEVEASIHAVLDAFQADSPFGAAAGATEAEFVLELLDAGQVDGSDWGGPNRCGCLIGSALRARDIPEDPVGYFAGAPENPYRVERINSGPAQDLFDHIRPGHTAQNHAPAAFARDCIQRWLNAQNLNGAPIVTVTCQGWTRRELEALQEEVKQ